MPPSAVVDTSVLVSAFLFPNSVPGDVLAHAQAGRYRLILSPIIIEEARRSLLNPRLLEPYGHEEPEVRAWCDALRQLGRVFEKLPQITPICRDPDDDHVIAAALAAKAEFIVSGDKDLLSLGRHEGIRILKAKAFLDEIASLSAGGEKGR